MDKLTVKKLFGNKDHLLKRYIVFLIGMVVCSFGIAFMTKSGLGTSPVTAIPYTLSLLIPGLSFGTWLVLFSFMQIVVQIILLRRKCIISELILQGVLAFLFGYVTDFSVFLLKGITLELYVFKIVMLFIGCFVLAFGIFLQLQGNVVMLSAEGFVWSIARVLNKPYGNIKIISDVSMSVFAGVLSLIVLGRLEGVREGTVIAALLLGLIVKLYQKLFDPII